MRVTARSHGQLGSLFDVANVPTQTTAFDFDRLPRLVVKKHRKKATIIWVSLLVGFLAYVSYVVWETVQSRKDPASSFELKVRYEHTATHFTAPKALKHIDTSRFVTSDRDRAQGSLTSIQVVPIYLHGKPFPQPWKRRPFVSNLRKLDYLSFMGSSGRRQNRWGSPSSWNPPPP